MRRVSASTAQPTPAPRIEKGREALLKYILRPPLGTERLVPGPDGLVRIALKRPFSDGTVAVDMDPLSLLCRLAAISRWTPFDSPTRRALDPVRFTYAHVAHGWELVRIRHLGREYRHQILSPESVTFIGRVEGIRIAHPQTSDELRIRGRRHDTSNARPRSP